MKVLEITNVDKSSWGDGPWQTEPDKVQWPDSVTGLPCLAVRNSTSGNWCGYVGVPEGHPAFKKGYNDVDVDVHGGLTFAGPCDEEKDVPAGHNTICHVPEPGEPDHVWWLGFDCAHAWDLLPGYRSLYRGLPGIRVVSREELYRTLAYVKEQCGELAQQLAAQK